MTLQPAHAYKAVQELAAHRHIQHKQHVTQLTRLHRLQSQSLGIMMLLVAHAYKAAQ
jgi:hypothetical protein